MIDRAAIIAAVANARARLDEVERMLAEEIDRPVATARPREGEKWIDSGTAAQLLGVSKQTARRWADRGLINGGRGPSGTWRFLRSSVIAARQPI